MKKIILFALLALLTFSLFVFAGSTMDINKSDTKDDINFLYDIRLEIWSSRGEVNKWYYIMINKSEETIKLTVMHYAPGEEGVSKQPTDYKLAGEIDLSEEQYKDIVDIISKIQNYDYDKDKERELWETLYYVPRYQETVSLTVQNNETQKKNNVSCEYFLIYDEYVKALIKRVIELSPVPIVNYWGVPIEPKDEEIYNPEEGTPEWEAKIAELKEKLGPLYPHKKEKVKYPEEGTPEWEAMIAEFEEKYGLIWVTHGKNDFSTTEK